MIGLDWEEKQREKRRNKIIMTLLGIFAVCGFVGILVTMYLEYEEYLPSENITIVRDNGSEEWGQTEKIIVETIGIAVESYSFDGGINWQESNEYIVIDKSNLSIVVRDLEGKQSEPLLYQTSNVDAIPPVINVKIPAKVLQNSKINLGEYVSATDDNSGLDGTIIMEPASLDTSKVGIKTIKITAKDKAGNVSSISVNVEIIKKSVAVANPNPGNSGNSGSGSTTGSIPPSGSVIQDGNVTLYRYRVKNTVSYICRTYDCSYYVDTGIAPTAEMFYNTMCKAKDEKVTFNTNCYIIPSAPNATCEDGQTVVNRYVKYKANGWTYVIDVYALDREGKQIVLESNFFESSGQAVSRPSRYVEALLNAASTNGESSLESSNKSKEEMDRYYEELYKTLYKPAPCGENEININGYCHLTCSGQSDMKCKNGFILMGDKCKKKIEKTCHDTCQKYTWSEWSEWSETPISSSDSIQVETKIVER